jgi:2-oxoacid:acceptor oxidoreductase delta subunit (pyruvate/2-ketoisovalerate family)
LPPGWELSDGRIHLAGDPAVNVFAAGDLSTGDGTVTHAIGDGRRAAGKAMRRSGWRSQIFERPIARKGRHRGRHPLRPLRSRARARAAQPREAAQRIARWDEVSLGLGERRRGARCFSCGDCTRCDTCLVYCPEGIIRRKGAGYEVDYTFCKGCGICVTECPRKAMEMSACTRS